LSNNNTYYLKETLEKLVGNLNLDSGKIVRTTSHDFDISIFELTTL